MLLYKDGKNRIYIEGILLDITKRKDTEKSNTRQGTMLGLLAKSKVRFFG
jgi:hypothetical protein